MFAPSAEPLCPLRARVEHEARRHFLAYSEVFQTGDAIVDVGVGSGFTAKLVGEWVPGADIVGLDVTNALREAVELVLYDGGPFPFDDAAFDVALVQYTLHHTLQPRLVLAEVARVTRRAVVLIEEFDLPGADPASEALLEQETLRALGLPPDMTHNPLARGELEHMLDSLPLRIVKNEQLPSRTPRRIEKRLYLLELERDRSI